MPTINGIERQIDQRVRYLVEVGLADQFQSGFRREVGRRVEITFPNSKHISAALKDLEYEEIYGLLVRERIYNVKMLDGALIQMMYEFADNVVVRHRLAFVPAPHLYDFQRSPDVYLGDELHADIVAKNVVPFPFRYDYDARDGRYQDVTHARSHLTLGQYENCRIPVSAPVTPHWFIDFLLRNFYDTPIRRYADEISPTGDSFDESITSAERHVVHVVIPVTARQRSI